MILGKLILMNRIIYLSFILFLLTSFGYREPNYCKIVDSITKSYLVEVAVPRDLILNDYGGAMIGDIKSISLSFLSHHALNVDEARILYVEMMEELLNRINCHEKIRPHLHNFPFEEANIKLTISFINSEGRTVRDGHVALMSIAKDHKLYFAAYNLNTEDFYDLCEESYEEARRIVKGQ